MKIYDEREYEVNCRNCCTSRDCRAVGADKIPYEGNVCFVPNPKLFESSEDDPDFSWDHFTLDPEVFAKCLTESVDRDIMKLFRKGKPKSMKVLKEDGSYETY